MRKILINFAHPAKSHSKINKALRNAVKDLEGITINDLYDHYPDFLIDVKREQKLCEDHDVIIFQHPFYWYQAPSIVKEWFDLVLEHGWAYGSTGNALQGKYYMQAITAGGEETTYQRDGFNVFTISELTSPYRAASKLCKMTWLPPFMVLGIHRGLNDRLVNAHAEDFRRTLIALRDETLDCEACTKSTFINEALDSNIRRI